jgi:hypothetical protein
MVTAAGTPGLYKNQCSCMFLLVFFLFAPLLPFLPGNSSNIWLYSRYFFAVLMPLFHCKICETATLCILRIVARVWSEMLFFVYRESFSSACRYRTGKFFKESLCFVIYSQNKMF